MEVCRSCKCVNTYSHTRGMQFSYKFVTRECTYSKCLQFCSCAQCTHVDVYMCSFIMVYFWSSEEGVVWIWTFTFVQMHKCGSMPLILSSTIVWLCYCGWHYSDSEHLCMCYVRKWWGSLPTCSNSITLNSKIKHICCKKKNPFVLCFEYFSIWI